MHRIFEIDEILRSITERIGNSSPMSAVSFACCCKAFDEPALNPLWREIRVVQLVQILPEDITRSFDPDLPSNTIPRRLPRQLTQAEWERLLRYASWVRKLLVYPGPHVRVLLAVLLESPTETIFPSLRHLQWHLPSPSLAVLHLLIGPRLEFFSMRLERSTRCSPERQSNLVEALARLPSSLMAFHLNHPFPREISTELNRAISSMVLRLGLSLNYLAIDLELSEPAIHHILQLPRLGRLTISQDIPHSIATSPLQSSEIFPYLHEVILDTQPDNWLLFLIGHKGIRKNLSRLVCRRESWGGRRTLTMRAIAFKNLVHLRIGDSCPTSPRQCNFNLTDDDISLIASTLSRLTRLELGLACRMNTCQNTFGSLLALSMGCLWLRELQIHFNTTNLGEDIKSTFASLRGVKRPGCRLKSFSANLAVLSSSEDSELIARGFLGVFPMLESFYPAVGLGWGDVAGIIKRTRYDPVV